MIDIPFEWWAAIIGLIYGVIGFIVRDVFPFSAYSMYSSAAMRDRAVVPVFFADGVESQMNAFTAFRGIDPEKVALRKEVHPCAHTWMVHEAQRWIREHSVPEGEATTEGEVEVSWGVHVLTIDENGKVWDTLDILVRGRADRR